MDEYADAIDALGLSVKSYGALGDGSNQTTAINNTITDATGEVYFPPGTYVVDPATLTEKSNVRWRGAGMYASVIKLKNSGNGKLLNWGASGPLAGISFVDLGFDGNMVNQTNGATRDDRSGLFLRQIAGLSLIRCGFTNFRSGAAVRTYGCSDILYKGNRFWNNGLRAVLSGAESLSTSATDVEVNSTAGWPSSGKFYAAGVVATYTSLGTSPTRFVGCTIASGTKALAAGTWVFPIGATDADVLICDATFTGAATDYRAIANRYFSNTDTGTAMDGVVGFSVLGNGYRDNLLGCGIAWVGTETGGTADSCEDGVIEGNTIIGPNLSSVETQGIKSAKYNAAGGDGGNNRNIVIEGNVIRLVDRSLWLDTLDDSIVQGNILKNAVGPNRQHVLLATGTETVNNLALKDNTLEDASVGVRIDTSGGVTDLTMESNKFSTDVTTPISGTIPATARVLGNMGAQDNIVTYSRGGTVLSPTAAVNLIVWRAPVACVVTAVKGYRVGGTGATINARRNGASNHLASALSLTSADTWMDGGTVQNTAYAAGDRLEIMVVTVAGSPTQVAVQVEFVRS
jgi:hypothetical protein